MKVSPATAVAAVDADETGAETAAGVCCSSDAFSCDVGSDCGDVKRNLQHTISTKMPAIELKSPVKDKIVIKS